MRGDFGTRKRFQKRISVSFTQKDASEADASGMKGAGKGLARRENSK